MAAKWQKRAVMFKLMPGVSFRPIAKRRLDQRQRRDCGCVRAQDARSEAEEQNTRRREDRGALVVVEAAFRPDQEAAAAARARASERVERARLLRLFVAKYEEPLRRPALKRFGKGFDRRNLRNPDHPALLASLDCVGLETLKVDPGDLGVAGDVRPQSARAHLDRLLRHIVEPRVLERREQVV